MERQDNERSHHRWKDMIMREVIIDGETERSHHGWRDMIMR